MGTNIGRVAPCIARSPRHGTVHQHGGRTRLSYAGAETPAATFSHIDASEADRVGELRWNMLRR
jgi:hypothetical protein